MQHMPLSVFPLRNPFIEFRFLQVLLRVSKSEKFNLSFSNLETMMPMQYFDLELSVLKGNLFFEIQFDRSLNGERGINSKLSKLRKEKADLFLPLMQKA